MICLSAGLQNKLLNGFPRNFVKDGRDYNPDSDFNQAALSAGLACCLLLAVLFALYHSMSTPDKYHFVFGIPTLSSHL